MNLHPQEASHRSATISVDMAHMLARYIDTLSQFLSSHELFHVQMNLMYVMIDLMGATTNHDPEYVVEQCKLYFASLKREKGGL